MKGTFIGWFNGLFHLCRHERWSYIGRVAGSFVEIESGMAVAPCYVKCKVCGRVLVRRHIYGDVIEAITPLAKSNIIEVTLLSHKQPIPIRVNVLIDNIREGHWLLEDAVVMSSYIHLSHQLIQLKVYDKRFSSISDQDKVFELYSIHHKNLVREGLTAVSLDHSRIFLQLLSKAYGYEKARSMWSWEIDEVRKVMVFSKRLKRR